MPIKTFRGLIPTAGTDTISLHTSNGAIGYRITKLQIISGAPGADTCELICKVHSISTAVSSTINFNDQTLLGVAYFQNVPVHSSSAGQPPTSTIIFDKNIFNQDIYIQSTDVSGNSVDTNYYMELEQVPLDLSENTVATLKDIRNITVPT